MTTETAAIKNKKRDRLTFAEFKKNLWRDKLLYAMMALPVIWYVIFKFIPLYWLQIAFKDFSLFLGVGKSEWVGLQHFRDYLFSPYFTRTLRNTVLISVYSLIFNFPLPIILALLYNEMRSKAFVRISQTLVYMPHFISATVVAGMVINFLSPSTGVINHIIRALGGEEIYFMAKPEYFRTIYIAMGIWQGLGFSSIIYIAALSSVDAELYEAATIDGAGRFRRMWHVSIPGILPTVIIQLILAVGHLLSVGYETIILLYSPAIYETADVISTFTYRTGLEEGHYDFAAAVGLFNSLVSMALVFCTNKLGNKLADTGLW